MTLAQFLYQFFFLFALLFLFLSFVTGSTNVRYEKTITNPLLPSPVFFHRNIDVRTFSPTNSYKATQLRSHLSAQCSLVSLCWLLYYCDMQFISFNITKNLSIYRHDILSNFEVSFKFVIRPSKNIFLFFFLSC